MQSLFRTCVAALVVILSGCGTIGGTIVSFNSPNGVIRISSDFITDLACRGRGFDRNTECQRGFNQENNRQVDNRQRAIEENYHDVFNTAERSVKYDESREEIVSTMPDCNLYPSEEARKGCRDGLSAGRQRALNDMRYYYLYKRPQMDRDYGAGKAAGVLK